MRTNPILAAGNELHNIDRQRVWRATMIARDLFTGVCSKQALASELDNQINEQYAALLPRTVRYDINRVRGGDSGRIERIIDYIDGIKQRQREIVEDYLADIELAYTVLERMDNPTEVRLLNLKYLSGNNMSWCDVANAMQYDERSVYRINKSALAHAQTIIDSLRDE